MSIRKVITLMGPKQPDPERERDNVVYWKTKRKINNDLQCLTLAWLCVVFLTVRRTPARMRLRVASISLAEDMAWN